ncbi:MAG: ATP-binding cassette domain-containing protein, partial [Vicinamibacteria bacterium]
MTANTPLVTVRDLTKVYHRGSERIDVLQGVTLDIPAGDFLALMGPSGSGKTTLLNLLGGLDRPTSGAVWLGDAELTALGEKAVLAARRDRIG